MVLETKWFGFSLALHLTAAACLSVLAIRGADHAPEAIMVMLDTFEMPEAARYPASKIPLHAEVRPHPETVSVAPGSTVATTPEAQASKPAAAPVKAVEQIQTREPQKTAVEQTASVPSKPVAPHPAPAVTQAVAIGGSPSAEKAQQQYLKEHFAYIRDQITGQLVYPPMARKMNWSGKVLIAFTIAEDGSVHGLRVAESSGFPVLDRSAMDTVKSAAPFPRPPVRADISVPIRFKMMK